MPAVGFAMDSTGEELVEVTSSLRELCANRVAPGKSRYAWAATAPAPGFAKAGSVVQTPKLSTADGFGGVLSGRSTCSFTIVQEEAT